jgi:hypothetical protein
LIVSLTLWLRKQVDRLEREIAASPVFESDAPVSREEIDHLTRLVVVHRFLEQELMRRSRVDTQEVPLAAAAALKESAAATAAYLF